MRSSLVLLVGGSALFALAASPANAAVSLASPRLGIQADAWGGQTMTAQLQASCDDGFGYVRVDLRQRDNTSTGFAGYVLTYNSTEVPCDGLVHDVSVPLSDNRFRPGPAELQAERQVPGSPDSTGWVRVKITKK